MKFFLTSLFCIFCIQAQAHIENNESIDEVIIEEDAIQNPIEVGEPLSNKYINKVDLGNGVTSFYEPGVYSEGGWTHVFTSLSNRDQVCKYLGMNSSVGSKVESMAIHPLMTTVIVQNDGSWEFIDVPQDAVITVIHCK